MDMQTYKTEALRTTSDQFHGHLVDADRFTDDTLTDLYELVKVVDGVKKGLFYGKQSDYLDDPDSVPEGAWDGIDKDMLHSALGLVTEATEFLEKVLGGADRTALISELGDVMWYANLATKPLETDLGKVADANITKLRFRYPKAFTADLAINKDAEAEDAEIGKKL
jgi:NTP pyrophosphatase (non-canonical NTP hydrolase)